MEVMEVVGVEGTSSRVLFERYLSLHDAVVLITASCSDRITPTPAQFPFLYLNLLDDFEAEPKTFPLDSRVQ
eukprot:COSAG02_NODE_2329_length_9121_cov_3.015183_1_plen_72_part_00